MKTPVLSQLFLWQGLSPADIARCLAALSPPGEFEKGAVVYSCLLYTSWGNRSFKKGTPSSGPTGPSSQSTQRERIVGSMACRFTASSKKTARSRCV